MRIVPAPRFLLTFLLTLGAVLPVQAADWPMWRNDAARSGATEASLPETLAPLWQRDYTPRVPVWDDPLNWDLMRFDRVLEPVVADGRMFLGFNDTDKVVALSTETGEELWRFYTDGPVRFAPAVWGDAVFVNCDDSYLYCLAAADGALRWKFRGGPSERKVLGNTRLISTWPARGGVMVRDGVVYFGASIWPMMGTFLYALDAATGAEVWRNDGTGATYMNQPHNSPSFAGVAPQGLLVASGDRLLVPGGRSVPACFDINTGDYLYYQLADSGKTGGAWVAGAGDVFFAHHREGVTSMYDAATGDKLVGSIGHLPVVTPDRYYFSGESVAAYDVAKLHQDREKWEDAQLWTCDADARGDLILAGNRLYAAGGGTITALELGPDDATPSLAWTLAVDGEVDRLAAADDKLFAVTREGTIHAFAAPQPGHTPRHWPSVVKPSEPVPASVDLESILSLGVTEGYALFHGAGDGRLLRDLALSTDLHIIATDPDPERVAALRRALDEEGLYGTRVAVHVGTPYTFDSPPYLASLTVLNSRGEPCDRALLERLFHSMRPYGGVAWLPLVEGFDAILENAALQGAENVEVPGARAFARAGQLEGAGTWTHMYGNVANTTKSDDRLVKLPLGVLWFGGSSNMDVLPRHGHGPPEQVIGGRLFIEGHDVMSARDVYTGRVLWQTPLHNIDTYGVYWDDTYEDTPTNTQYNQVHIPGANVRGTNFVATEDRLYVIEGGGCAVLDTANGEQLSTFYLPRMTDDEGTPLPPEWGYIGVYDSLLLGGNQFVRYSRMSGAKTLLASVWTDFDTSASRHMVVLDRYTGKVRWQVEALHGFLNNGTVAGNNMLFLMDKLPLNIAKRLARRGATPPGAYALLAFDVRSGQLIWHAREDVFGSFLAYSEEHDVLLQTTRPSRDMVEDEEGERMIAYQGKTGELLWDRELSYNSVPMLHGERVIFQGGMISLLTGEDVPRIDPVTGLEMPWDFERKYGCNYPIASEHLLTFRSAAAGFYDLLGDAGTGNLGGFKSGCTSNLVVAEGVLNAPDYTRTCSCAYQNQTSLALVHMPDAEVWTYMKVDDDEEKKAPRAPVQRLGINFGAPGDRLAESGTLWFEYPVVGGPSPDLGVTVSRADEAEPRLFRHHASLFGGEGPNWVMASGLMGPEHIEVKVADDATPRRYTVRLYFAEPELPGAAPRPVTVLLQGAMALGPFDAATEAGGSRRGTIRTFTGVEVTDTLVIDLGTAPGSTNTDAVLSGIELIAEDA